MRIILMLEWSQHAHETLASGGVRAGGARNAVIDLLAGEQCCLSAQEMWERLSRRKHSASLASVYRTVELLHDQGLLQRVDVGAGVARYERALPGGEHHHHVVCDSCGGITPFEDEPLERAIDALGNRLRHRVAAHEVVIHGVCPKCAA
jgi:Fur family ferric uptake transcriptional regulator